MGLNEELPASDDESYLIEPADWSDQVSIILARQENIGLTDAHRVAINFKRDYFQEQQVIPDVRFVTRHLAQGLGGSRNLIFEPFPYGYVKQACRIASMRRPRGWSDGLAGVGTCLMLSQTHRQQSLRSCRSGRDLRTTV